MWLNHQAKSPDPNNLPELVEMDLLLNEFVWQLRSVHMGLQQVLNDPALSALPQAETIRRMAEDMNQAIAESRTNDPDTLRLN